MHRAGVQHGIAVIVSQPPSEAVQRALFQTRVILQPLLEQPGDGALARTHRSVQQQNSPIRAVSVRRRLEEVHELHQRMVQAEDGVLAVVDRVAEEVVADVILLQMRVTLASEMHDHVIHALKGVAGHLGFLGDKLQVILKCPLPVEIQKLLLVDVFVNDRQDGVSGRHEELPPRRRSRPPQFSEPLFGAEVRTAIFA